jgi:hypothetical protein
VVEDREQETEVRGQQSEVGGQLEECCGLCVFYLPAVNMCRRYPSKQYKAAADWCGEYKSHRPSQELLSQPTKVLLVDVQTQRILDFLKFETLEDLVDLGPTSIRRNGKLDRTAINDIRRRMRAIGIQW